MDHSSTTSNFREVLDVEQVITEVYRTNENRQDYTFTSCVTLTYFGDTVFIQALSGTFTIACWRELRTYLQDKGIKEAKYLRRGKLVSVQYK